MIGNKCVNKYTKYVDKIFEKNKKQNIVDEIAQPKITVIVPCYNVEKYVIQCLETLVNQTFKNIEIICIDDGSTDCTNEILSRFCQHDKRIKIVTQQNSGVSVARNKGLMLAKGEYISFIDSDDWVDKNYFENLLSAIERNNCDIAAATIIRKRKYFQKNRVHYTKEIVYKTLQEKINICKIPQCCYIWNKLYKKELIGGTIFKEGVLFEDVLWLPQIIKKARNIVTVPNTQYYYRVRKNSIVKEITNKQKQLDSYNSKKYIIKFFKENNLELPHEYEHIIKKIIYVFNIPIFKIKEKENTETGILFGFIPIYKLTKKGNSRFILNILSLKFTLRKNKLSDKRIKELNLTYEKGLGNIPKVYNAEKTLNKLINSNYSICRFGDGEFNLINGENLNFQKFDQNLQEKLASILKTNETNVMVCIPDVFSSLDHIKAKSFWRKYLAYNRSQLYSLLNMDKQYYDSLITRVYIDTEKTNDEYGIIFNKFKTLWNEKHIVIVEGESSRLGVGNDLFNNADELTRIICPAINAFDKYEEIFNLCKTMPKGTLFIIALGPTATVLAYDLAQLGYQALDLGHIDIEYEWFLMGAKKKIPIKNKYVNEAKNGRKITIINDNNYLKQVIADLSI